jgi:hypothetical protein
MKKYLLLISCTFLSSIFVSAQEEIIMTEEEVVTIDDKADEEEVQSSVAVNGSSYGFIFSWKKKPTESHWTGIGFAFSNLKNLEEADLNLSRSYSVMLNLMDYTVPLHHHWLFVTGLGFDWSRYHFKGNTGLQDVDGIARFVKNPEWEYESNKLLVYYATIPFLLEYQTKIGRNKHFFLQAGVEGLIKCYSKSQLDMITSHGVDKVNYHDLNILPVNARLVVRTGFDNFSFIGYYQPFSMFEKGKGPAIRSFGIGIMLN